MPYLGFWRESKRSLRAKRPIGSGVLTCAIDADASPCHSAGVRQAIADIEVVVVTRTASITEPDLVDEASDESFPASDAPSWAGVTSVGSTH